MMNSQKMDSDRERDAFDELRPQLDKLTELRRANVDVEKAASQIVVIGRMILQPEVMDMFLELSPRVFDMQHVHNLEKAGLATLYAVVKHRDAAVHGSQAMVPASTAQEATELRLDMLQVVKYHLRDEHNRAIIADIESGHGHADRASDLRRLGNLYETHHQRLAKDHVYYRREDADKARELARRIYAHLGGETDSNERTWAGYVQRAWTFLLNTYDEVCAAGRFLYRHQDGEQRFPSLVASLRSARRTSNDSSSDSTDWPEDDMAAENAEQLEAVLAAIPENQPEATSEPELA